VGRRVSAAPHLSPLGSTYRHVVSKPPQSPYPPDLDDAAPQEEVEFGALVDVVAADLAWANLRRFAVDVERAFVQYGWLATRGKETDGAGARAR
jgi:predicted component of type VI protein secretion system